MVPGPIDSKSAGIQNEKLILSLLKTHKTLSQSQICRLAKLSSSTVSYIVGRLREKGLILETVGPSIKRGAKPVLLSINPAGLFVVAVDINPAHLSLGLFDFNSHLCENIKAPLDSDHSAQNVCQILEINLRGLLSRHDIASEKLLGIAVTVSGSVDSQGNIVLSSPMGWKNIPLKDMLAPGLPAPVSVFSTRVRLLAEPFTAQGNGKKNILYVNIGNGVGANIIIDGNFVHGATNRTSEIGHIVIDPEGPLCGCGNKGCLETFISGPAIAQRIKNDIASGTQTSLTKTVLQADTAESVIEKWGCALGENDPYALNLQNDIAEKLSTAVSIAINCYDPSLVILAGYVAIECCDFLIKTIREKMKTQVYNSDSRPIDILQAQAGRNALMVGAAAALFEDFMKI